MKKFAAGILTIILTVTVLCGSLVYAENKEFKVKTNAKNSEEISKLENALKAQAGVVEAKVNPQSKLLTVTYDEGKIQEEAICKTVCDLGFNKGKCDPKSSSDKSAKSCCSDKDKSKCTDAEKMKHKCDVMDETK